MAAVSKQVNGTAVNGIAGARKPGPRLRAVADEDGTTAFQMNMKAAEGSAALCRTFGTEDPDFASGLLKQLGRAVEPSVDEYQGRANHQLAAVEGIAPQDEAEAMLAVQMISIHTATMKIVEGLDVIIHEVVHSILL